MTIDDFEKIKKDSEYLLVDFFATWCMPCKMQLQVIEELHDKNINGLTIQKIDVDIEEELTNEFKIVSVPTLILFKNGEMVKKMSGLASVDDIVSWLK